MGEPHAFEGLVDLPEAAAEDRPMVTRGAKPPIHHVCRGGDYLHEGRWRTRRECGLEVQSWPAKGDVPPVIVEVEPVDRESPQDDIAEWRAAPGAQVLRLLPRRIYAGLCERCGREEREGRGYLRKLAEQGESPRDADPRGRGYRSGEGRR